MGNTYTNAEDVTEAVVVTDAAVTVMVTADVTVINK